MTLFHAALLGFIEGITEFLPISSTGHLILTSHLLQLPDTEFLRSFEIIIQLGAILAVVVYYFKKLFLNFKVFSRIAVAFIPTAILGLLLYSLVKTYLIGNIETVLWSLLIGGVVMIIFELIHEKSVSDIADLENVSYGKAFLIGIFQTLALIPGVSRSGATVIGGLALGLSRQTIVEFSFLLAIPTMAAATGLDVYKNYGSILEGGNMALLIMGFLVAFLCAYFAIKFLLKYIQNHTFIPFGIYRILIALLFLYVIKL